MSSYLVMRSEKYKIYVEADELLGDICPCCGHLRGEKRFQVQASIQDRSGEYNRSGHAATFDEARKWVEKNFDELMQIVKKERNEK